MPCRAGVNHGAGRHILPSANYKRLTTVLVLICYEGIMYIKAIRDLLRATTTAAALTALDAPSVTATDAELRAGTSSATRMVTPLVLGNLASTTCTTATRPTDARAGYSTYDTTINKPIWLKTAPSTWVDATGLAV